MDAVDLLNDDRAELPRTAPLTGSYVDHLKETLAWYVGAVRSLTGGGYATNQIRAHASEIRDLAERVLAVHDAALRAHFDTAQEEMEAAINGVQTQFEGHISRPLDPDKVGLLYRVRPGTTAHQYERKDIFHVPFDQRHNVGTARYSLPGIPMLYLGSTLYAAWEEMGRKPLEELWVSALRLRAERTLRVVNFGYRPAQMAALLDQRGERDCAEVRVGIASAILWPLIAACSFRRRFPTAPYAEEYLVPQQLIGYLARHHDYDGIRYFSTRVQVYGEVTLTHAFALPARPGPSAGHCPHLAGLFDVTPPVPASLVTNLGPALNCGDPLIYSRRGVFAPYGQAVEYTTSNFARIEAFLRDYDFEPLVL